MCPRMFLDLFVNCGDDSHGSSRIEIMFLLKAVQLSVCWACNEARLPKTMIDTGKLVRSQFQLLGFRLLKALGHWGPPTPITYVKQYKIFAINHFMRVPSCCTIVTIDFECIYFLPVGHIIFLQNFGWGFCRSSRGLSRFPSWSDIFNST